MKACFNCDKDTENTLYDFPVCSECQTKLKLMSPETVKRHLAENPSFESEAQEKLAYLEKDYARKKIELRHILEQLKSLG